MGIPAFFSYVVKQHKTIIKRFGYKTILVDNLLLDSNSIVYDCLYNLQKTHPELSLANKQNYENVLIEEVCNKIKYYIETIRPNKMVYISFDGVAPVAKLEQQRTRRYKSWFTNTVHANILEDKNEKWDTTNITPGTDFMVNLNEQIHEYFKDASRFNVDTIKISTSLEPGEGEHKLFLDIRDNEKYMSESTVIYGLDADLIMLSLNHVGHCDKIYLFRETPEFIKHLDSSLDPNKLYVLDINGMSDNLIAELNNGETVRHEYQKNRIHDYIFICFMLGNDFIPHIPCINIRTHGITHLLDAYKFSVANNRENITDGVKINWGVFRKFIKYLADNESDYYNLEYSIREKQGKRFYPSKTPEEKINKFTSLPIQNREREIYINPGEEYWESRYYQTLFDVDGNEEDIKRICINYLEALDWTFKYYTAGCCNWRWSYNYNYPPLMKDLIRYVPCFDMEFVKSVMANPVKDVVQLSYVLPKHSLGLLAPEKLDILMQNVPEYYTDDCEFQWSFCKYFWEAHINMPHIDLEKLETLVG